jgi:hypothetical protein
MCISRSICASQIFSLADPAWATRNGVHFGLFMNAISGQGDDEQVGEWMGLTLMCQILGCFAMVRAAASYAYSRGLGAHSVGWPLPADGAGARELRARPGDHSDIRPRDRRVRDPLAHCDRDQVVDRRRGAHGQLLDRVCAAGHRRPPAGRALLPRPGASL